MAIGRRELMHMPFAKVRRGLAIVLLGLAAFFCLSSIGAGTQQSTMAAEGKDQPYLIEYYYKTKWGHAEEFLALFKKNNYQVWKKEVERGRMITVSMAI